MKKITIFFIGFLFLGNICFAQNKTINGYEWQKLSTGFKLGFVQGWGASGQATYSNLPIAFGDKGFEFGKGQIEALKDEGIILGGVTVGQVTDTIDKLYLDARIKNMDIAEVMPFVNGRLIQGWTENELDNVIALKVKLKQCEKKETITENCGSIRQERNAYLQKLKKQ